jgi:hypothetical protein
MSPPVIEIDAYSKHGHMIIVCNKGLVTAFCSFLEYLASLALQSFSLAVLVRNVTDKSNEA